MIGQGGPTPSLGQFFRGGAALLIGFAVMTWMSTATAETLMLRIDWGGNRPIRYRGNISLSQGEIGQINPLGVEADEPGSIWVERNQVWIAPVGYRVYDGLDMLVDASIDATVVRVELALDPETESTSIVEVPLAKLLQESVSSDLDKHGTRVLLRRSPGDALRVRFDERPLIFNGKEDFSFELIPYLLPPLVGRAQIEVRLSQADDTKIIKQIATIDLEEQGHPIPIRVPLSQSEGIAEGAYDVVIDLVRAPALNLPQVGPVPVGRKKILLSRKIQVLVLDPSKPTNITDQPGTLKVIEEIDPANPTWWDRFTRPPQALAKLQLANLPGLKVTSLESGDLSTVNHKLGQMARLAPNRGEKTSWEAYVLTVRQTGTPHVLELEYPSDVSQALAISVMEPNATGALTPIQFDSGVLCTEDRLDLSQETPKILKHRLVFWPKTTSPIVLLANHSETSPVVHGKLRLSAGWNRLPPAEPQVDSKTGRLFAAYFDQPMFYQSFGAKEAFDSWGRSLDDWDTYYQGGTRLMEYLKHVGANGLMMSVASDGGAIYPSNSLRPTPRFEKGTFFASGQDPIRKDVLEMLLTMCDREQIRMIPAIRLNSLLPLLEEQLRAIEPTGPASEKMGIHLLGPGGRLWRAEDAAGVAPFTTNDIPAYNILDPRVQDAVLEAMVELLDRYAARHESLAGLALQMSYDSFLQLPGPEWGVDDVTVARFEKETGVKVDNIDAGETEEAVEENKEIDRFTQRAKTLCGKERAAWLAWRAEQLHQFHCRLQNEVATKTNGGTLYLTGANLVVGPTWQNRLRGTPAYRMTILQALLEVGLDPNLYQSTEGPVLVCPERVGIFEWSDDAVAAMEMTRMLDATGPRDASPLRASMFYNVPSPLRVKSFDDQKLARVSFTRIESQLAPSDLENRQRFAHRLAMFDTRVFFDGGRFLPMGQESSIQNLMAIYRSLPDIPFQQWTPKNEESDSIQPVTIRYADHEGYRYYYLVNDSPFTVGATLDLESAAPLQLERIGRKETTYEKIRRTGQTTTWSPTLQPYELIAVRIQDQKNQLIHAKASIPSEVSKRLASRIMELGLRAAALRAPASMNVLPNPSFEMEAPPEMMKGIFSSTDANYNIPGWLIYTTADTQVQVEPTEESPSNAKPPGKQCIHLKSDGGMVAIASEPFESPQTGRLWIYSWIRISDEAKQPTVEVILTGKHKGRDFVRGAVLGRQRNGQPAPTLSEEWWPCKSPINDLPFEGLENISIGFRLVGEGEVWIDDVQLCHLAGFGDQDIQQLSRMVSVAEMKLQSNRISDCLRLLEGLWPQYLERNVSVATVLAERPRSDPKPKKEPESSASLFDRMKSMFK